VALLDASLDLISSQKICQHAKEQKICQHAKEHLR
jgi:hypothetical protein